MIETGYYTIIINSTIDTVSYVYKNNFNVFDPQTNLIPGHTYTCCDHHFKIIVNLEINITYVLVATTLDENEQEKFSVVVSGPNNVSFNLISEYL